MRACAALSLEVPHDVNQPLEAAIQTGLGNVFSSTPLAILQPRTALAWQFDSKSVLRAGFGVFSDILPGSIADVVGVNPPYVKTFQGGLLGTVGKAGSAGCDGALGCTAIAPGVPNSAIDATVAANQTFSSGFAEGQLSCASAQSNPATCLPPVAITAVPDGKLHAPYFLEWSLGLERELGSTVSIHAQYVGTRAVNQPYLTQVNGYQTVCDGCFAPFPLRPCHRSEVWSRDPIFHGREQPLQRAANVGDETHGPRPDGTNQLHVQPLHGHSFKRRVPAIFGRRNSVAAAGRSGARLRPLRLRHTAQFQCAICLSASAQGEECDSWDRR